MRVGLTGGAGFIGGHIIEALVARGHQVTVFDHQGRIDPQIMFGLDSYDRDAITVMLGDVRDSTAVTELAAHVDGIIHLAAVLGTQETIGNPRPSAETNILGSLNVFEAAAQYGLPVVYAGVGNHWMRDHGAGSYTISKTAAEDWARMFNAYRGGRISIVRPVNAYGPRQSVAAPYGSSKVRKILPAMACRALTGTPIEVYGDGTQISDCVYVTDVAKAFVTALEQTRASIKAPAKPIEVGPADSVTVNDIARLVAVQAARLTGRDPVEIKHLPMRPGEVPNAVVSANVTTLAQIGLDADQFVPLHEGVALTVEWYARNWLPAYAKAVA
ncbi:NAD(P)-dependent oxidoreductase [Microbispora sp. KK1-11]|uniref:NAD-dependent epimerase/dehydratase family protein n=1 Tax=Microbispora sp. KK1-11 TaxID=2053005 RepID=UPI001158423E|nr:NAD-dependent epimerase/dehydratase family protein [Microbispora sp. KK1-11]TQS30065.1 NAD-dependent epimerase/dehydratase family protein [Microbispora sp. KK1-11]